MVRTYTPHISPIRWYLQKERKHIGDWTYRRCIMTGENKRYPEAQVKGWEVLYKGEVVTRVRTRKEVDEFIKEKEE